MIKSVCVIGSGVIGSLYAAHLSRVAEVSVLTRRGEHADALSEHGLRVSGKSDFTAHLVASADPDALPPFQLGVVATKATGLEDAAQTLEGRFPDATMMTIQNGLGAEEILAAHGAWPIISAVTFMSGVRHSDSHVEYELDTATWMGPYEGTSTPYAVVEEVRDLLVAGGLKAEAFPDLRPAQWSKLIFNATVNTVAAMTGLGHVRAFAEEGVWTDLGHLVHGLMEEGKAVAAAAGVDLYEDPWEMNVHAVRKGETKAAAGEYAHVPSMLEDVNARRRTEVDFISGALVREAHRLGVSVPLHEAMVRLIKAKEASWA